MRSSLGVTQLVVGQMEENCYLIEDLVSKQTLIIDPGDDPEYIIDKLTRLEAKPLMILATHGHFDHIMAARALQLAYKIPFLVHSHDRFLITSMQDSAKHFLGLPYIDPGPEVTHWIKEGTTISFGAIPGKVIHSPGHTPGSVCVHFPKAKMVFVGDTIFAGGLVGRTDFSYSVQSDLQNSLRKILSLPKSTVLYAGHGPTTTIDAERSFHGVL